MMFLCMGADSIYRKDVVLKTTRAVFHGITNYKLVLGSLRFYGKMFYSKLSVEVMRIWQPSDDTIKIRWAVRGTPRVPWEAEAVVDGISTFKLDCKGRVYEHSVDNLLPR